ncbi:MAG: hypothetical protein V1792_13880 [Pseudomonadota bacterium]
MALIRSEDGILGGLELQDAGCHRSRSFPKTGLHRVRGIRQAIYRGDIKQGSAWLGILLLVESD